MGLFDFLRSTAKMLAVAHKSDRQEFILYLKLVLMGLATAGTLGFIVQFIGSILKATG